MGACCEWPEAQRSLQGFWPGRRRERLLTQAMGLDGFQKRRHFPKVVMYSCDELGDNQVQKAGKGSFEEEGRSSVKLL